MFLHERRGDLPNAMPCSTIILEICGLDSL